MLFFRKMNEEEIIHSRKGMIFGFFIYMFATGLHYMYFTVTKDYLFSPLVLLLTGLVASFAYEMIVNMKKKK